MISCLQSSHWRLKFWGANSPTPLHGSFTGEVLYEYEFLVIMKIKGNLESLMRIVDVSSNDNLYMQKQEYEG